MVGINAKNRGRFGVIESLVGQGRGRKFTVKWTVGLPTLEASKGIDVAAGGAEVAPPQKKRARREAEDTNSEASLEMSGSSGSSSDEDNGCDDREDRFSFLV